MEINERIKALEDEFQETRDEIKKLLVDIRSNLMDATSPLNNNSDNN